MSPFSFQKHKDETISAIFEIGSGSVAGALVRFSTIDKPQLLYSYRKAVAFREIFDHNRFVSDMVSCVKHVAENMGREGLSYLGLAGHFGHSIHDIFYSFTSPWVLSQTTIIDIKKDTDILVTKSFLDNILAKEQHSFEQLTKEGDSSTVFDKDALMIEKKMIQVRLNGYPTSNPYKKTAHQIETAFCVSFVPRNIMEKIDEAIEKTFNFRKVTPHSLALLSYTALRDLFPIEKDFVFIDIHGELTDAVVVKNGILVNTFSFPFGTHTLIRNAARLSGLSPSIIGSYLRMHAFGKNDEATKIKIQPIFEKLQKEWLASFGTAYSTLPEKIALPHTFFVITDNDTEIVFVDILKDSTLHGVSMTASLPKVITLDDSSLLTHCTLGRKLIADAPLMLQAIALNTFLQHK